jgi:hypothetical protein
MKNTFFLILILVSCGSIKLNNTLNGKDTDVLENCVPVKVLLENKNIGYIIRNNDIETDEEFLTSKIISFESILEKNYGKYYNSFYRQYSFYKNKNGDLILNALYLNQKEIDSNPNWKCHYHEVGFYRKKYKKNYPDAFFYNTITQQFSINSL